MSICKHWPQIGCVIITGSMFALALLGDPSPKTLTVERSLTWRDYMEIQSLVRERSYLPIFSIESIGSNRVAVILGDGKFTECGMGRYDELKKVGGRWCRD